MEAQPQHHDVAPSGGAGEHSTMPEAVAGQSQVSPWTADSLRSPRWISPNDYEIPEVVPGEHHYGESFPQRRMVETEDASLPQLKVEAHVEGKSARPWWRRCFFPLIAIERSGDTKPARPWWRRRNIIFAVIVVLVLIALVVGLTVGLVVSKRNSGSPASADSPSPSSTSTPSPDNGFGTPLVLPATISRASVCRGTICPATIAITQPAGNSSFFIFARGSDSAIWYRQANMNSWNGEWTSLGSARFISQPVAVSSGSDRVDVFAVRSDEVQPSSSVGSIYQRTYQNGQWSNDWLNLGGRAVNPPTVCSSGPDKLDIFSITNNTQVLMHRSYDGTSWEPPLDKDWTTSGGYCSAAAAAVCKSNTNIDVISFGSYAGSLHDAGWMHHIRGEWSEWEGNSRPGEKVGYRGDPTLFSIDDARSTFVGMGTDMQLYATTFTNGKPNNMSNAEPLQSGSQGGFESVPHMVVGGPNRFDFVAVGKDDRLKHKAWRNEIWAVDWEDLGGYFNSAPVAVQGEGWMAVFGIGLDGHMIHGNWSVKADSDHYIWGEGRWFDDGGQFATSWFRSGPA